MRNAGDKVHAHTDSPPLTAAEKRTATRRANKEKRLARRRGGEALAAIEANQPKRRCSAETEASLLKILAVLQGMLAECRAEIAQSASDRRELARLPVVDLAQWRGIGP